METQSGIKPQHHKQRHDWDTQALRDQIDCMEDVVRVAGGHIGSEFLPYSRECDTRPKYLLDSILTIALSRYTVSLMGP